MFSSPRMAALRAPSVTRGFTLMEILVVIVIIGIIVSAATLSINVLGRDSEAEEEMRRLWAVLVQAREESELQGIDTGVFISEQAYEFLRFDPRENRWIPVQYDTLFAPRQLPEELRFRMWVESRAIVLRPGAQVDREDISEDKKWPPQIMVLSSGEILPFELQVERDAQDALWRLESRPDGDLRLERRDGTEPWQIVMQTKPSEADERERRLNAKR